MCSSHLRTRKLVGKTFRQGFYCPLAVADEVVRTSVNCIMHSPYKNFPASEVQLIPPIMPLSRWSMDIIGPLSKTRVNYAYIVIPVEYFTKWVAAKPIQNKICTTIQRFFWQNIICRFEVPRELTVNDGKHFDSLAFQSLCNQLGTKACFASVYYP